MGHHPDAARIFRKRDRDMAGSSREYSKRLYRPFVKMLDRKGFAGGLMRIRVDPPGPQANVSIAAGREVKHFGIGRPDPRIQSFILFGNLNPRCFGNR